MALPKKNRIRKKDFSKLFSNQKKAYSKFFFLVYQLDDNLSEDYKLTVSVSKKISSNATDRNKIKRLVLEGFKDIISKTKINKAIILLRTKREILGRDRTVITNDLKNLFIKEKIIDNI